MIIGDIEIKFLLHMRNFAIYIIPKLDNGVRGIPSQGSKVDLDLWQQ